MKILVVSIAPWNRNNNFGKTFCDIFEGMENVEFLNIYCANGRPENNVTAQYYQITMGDIAKNLLNKRHKIGRVVKTICSEEDNAAVLNSYQQAKVDLIKSYRLRIFFWARRFIWWVGRWRTEELNNVIKNFDADLLFLPIFKESYMNSVQQYVMKISGKKAVAYYGDDNYTLRIFSWNPFFWLDRFTQRKDVKRTIDQCEYMYVVSDIEKKECERDFNKRCIICTKGAFFAEEPPIKKTYKNSKRLVYTGNLGNHRWEELYYIGKALESIGGNHELLIYSGTPLTKTIHRKYAKCSCIRFMGKVSAAEIPKIQDAADILVHVESFRLKERLLVHQSFSTKLVDHFSRARCTFGVGAKDVASIDHLIKHDAAIVATSRKEIQPQLRKLLADDNLIREYALKGYECGKKFHNINVIQSMLCDHFRTYFGVADESINS